MDQKFLLTLILSYGLSSTDKKETFYHGIKDLSRSPFYLFSFISYLPFKLKKNLQITDYASSSCFCLFVHIVPFASRLQTAFHCLAKSYPSDQLDPLSQEHALLGTPPAHTQILLL